MKEKTTQHYSAVCYENILLLGNAVFRGITFESVDIQLTQ